VSPVYRIGSERIRRKHWYMPCALGPEFDQASDEDQARLLKATYWADYITAAEWEALLGEEGCSPSARSRLKKKAAGWLVALGRIAALNPDLFLASVEQALRLYAEQTRSEYPGAWLAGSVMQLERMRQTLDEHGTGIVSVSVQPPAEDDAKDRQ
jgi:hypothetical protein